MSLLRTLFNKKYGETVFKKEKQKLLTEREIHDAHVLTQQHSRALKQTNVKDFNVERLINFKNQLIQSDKWLDKVLLVQLCVGCRFIEVLKVSHFFSKQEANNIDTPEDLFIPEDDEKLMEDMNIGGSIVVVGVAKSRRVGTGHQNPDKKSSVVWDLELEDDEEQYDLHEVGRILPSKPVMFLTPRAIVWLVYKVIRPKINAILESQGKNINTITLSELTGLFNDRANSRLAEWPSLSSDNIPITTHWLRKIYANYSYDNVGSKTGITRTAWISKVLGHLPKSFTTALSYNTASITTGVERTKYENPELIESELKNLVDFYSAQMKQVWQIQKAGKILSEIKEVDTHTEEVLAKLNHLQEADKKRLEFTTLYSSDYSQHRYRRVQKSMPKIEKVHYFQELTEDMEKNSIPLTYENYRRLGFANSFIKTQKASN
jgi:hypothetical protein